MLVKLTEVCGNGAVTSNLRYSLREVFVNPEHVVMVREEHQMRNLNEQGMLTEGLDKKHRFSKITIDKGTTGTDIVVIGDPTTVETALNNRSYVLKG
jgi:ketopantoate reductase